MAMTKGTRRSSFPTSAALNDIKHSNKVEKFTDIGYEIIAENGFTATLAYYPYGGQYVKIAMVENGKAKSSVILTPKQLKALNDRVQQKKNAKAN